MSQQLFVKNPFRRRVLINDQQLLPLFGQDLDPLELAKNTNR